MLYYIEAIGTQYNRALEFPQLKCMQHDWVREFTDYNKSSANSLFIDLLISNSNGQSMLYFIYGCVPLPQGVQN